MEDKRRIVRVIAGEVTEEGHTTLDMIDDILDEYNGIRKVDDIMGEDPVARYDDDGVEVECETKEGRHQRMRELRKEFEKRAARLSE